MSQTGHSRPPRRRRTSRPRLRRLRRLVERVALGLLVLLFCAFAALGVIGVITSREPVLWGTFTGQACEPARFGCQNIGTWASDDGAIHLEQVHLDGALQPVESIRASYRPTGLLNDADNNIVHTESFSTAGIWAPWVGALAMVLVAVPEVRRLRSQSVSRREPAELSAEVAAER